MKWFKELVILACTMIVGAALGNAALSEVVYKGPRMEQIGSQEIINNGGVGADMFVRYLHDHDTKQEVVCISAFVHADGVMSCYPTGRTW